jgi:hypothetical protein
MRCSRHPVGRALINREFGGLSDECDRGQRRRTPLTSRFGQNPRASSEVGSQFNHASIIDEPAHLHFARIIQTAEGNQATMAKALSGDIGLKERQHGGCARRARKAHELIFGL